MATSGSYDYTIKRDIFIKDCLVDLGVHPEEDTVPSAANEHASRKLNLLLKAFQGKGLNLWKAKRATLLLQKSQRSYNLGPSGDHFFLESEMVETTMRIAGITNDTILQVTSTTGMVAADYIGVELDSGSMHFTTIQSITDSDTLVLTAGMPSASAVGSVIYTYTTKAQRPLNIIEAWRRTEDDTDTPIIPPISREEYARQGDKFTAGTINRIYYDPQLTNGVLYVLQPASVVSDTLEMWVHYPVEDMDSALNDFDCPPEWLLAIQLNFQLLLCPKYGIQGTQLKTIMGLAVLYLEIAEGADKEMTSIYVTPDN